MFSSTQMPLRLSQLLNATSPIVVTLAEILISSKAAQELKWDLGSIAFAGFGNIREVRCSMPIITVDEHDFDVGRTAFEKLHRIIQGETRNEPREEILPVELIVRESTDKNSRKGDA